MDKNKKVTYSDKRGSWFMYVELNTKMTTQSITQVYKEQRITGDVKSALDSIYSIFPSTRRILTTFGSDGERFANLAFGMLNVEIRPFTTKWHRIMTDEDTIMLPGEFQEDLKELQDRLVPFVNEFYKMANTPDGSLYIK